MVPIKNNSVATVQITMPLLRKTKAFGKMRRYMARMDNLVMVDRAM